MSIGIKLRAVRAIANKLIESHKKKEIDIIWFNHLSFYDVYPLTLLAKYLNIPTIQSYEDERFELVSSEKLSLSKRVFAVNSWFGDQYCPKLADAIVVISNYLKSKYDKLSKAPGKVHIVPTIIDCEEWVCPKEENTLVPTILYSGAFNEQDEIENLIEAFAILRSNGYKFRVVMLGGNERHSSRMSKVYEQIDRLGLSSLIEIKGFVPLAEVKTQVCKSHILINVRRDSVYSRSGLSTKLSEYLASGRMVISSDVGDVSRYVSNGESALLVPSTVTVDEITQALSQVLQSNDLRRRIGAAGRDVAKRYFDVSVAKVKLQVILDELLKEIRK
jgi:glycosyltransferase involved in cell wall biosynthesis